MVHLLELTTVWADHHGRGEGQLVVGSTHAFAALRGTLLWNCHGDTIS